MCTHRGRRAKYVVVESIHACRAQSCSLYGFHLCLGSRTLAQLYSWNAFIFYIDNGAKKHCALLDFVAREWRGRWGVTPSSRISKRERRGTFLFPASGRVPDVRSEISTVQHGPERGPRDRTVHYNLHLTYGSPHTRSTLALEHATPIGPPPSGSLLNAEP